MNKKLILLVSTSLTIHFSSYAAEKPKKADIMVLPNIVGGANPIAMLMLVPQGQGARIAKTAATIDADLQVGTPVAHETLVNFLNSNSVTTADDTAESAGGTATHIDKRAKRTPEKKSIFNDEEIQRLKSESIYNTQLLLAALEEGRIEDDCVAPAFTDLIAECISEVHSTMLENMATEALEEIKMDSLIIRERTAEDGPWKKSTEVVEEITLEQDPTETRKTLITGPVGWLAVDKEGNPCVIPSTGTTATPKTLMTGPVGWLTLTQDGKVAVTPSTLASASGNNAKENS